MGGARNKVIAGDYPGYSLGVDILGRVNMSKLFSATIYLNKDNVEDIEVVDSDKMKSGGSAITRGAIGAVLLGPIGVFAAAGAKNKNVITLVINFRDGRRSLAEVDQKVYKALQIKVF